MIRFLLLFLAVTLSTYSDAQIKAKTETGRDVVLLESGRWRYANDSTDKSSPDYPILENTHAYTKGGEASFLLKSKTLNIGVFLNPSDWGWQKGAKAEAAEYNFTQKNGPIAGFLITENTKLELESMVQIALTNARSQDSLAAIVKKEYRTVNGVRVLCLQLKFAVDKQDFVLLGYYYSSEKGVVQLVASTTAEFFRTEQPAMERFLNGFVVI